MTQVSGSIFWSLNSFWFCTWDFLAHYQYTYLIWKDHLYMETENVGALMKEHIEKEVFAKEFSIYRQENQLKINLLFHCLFVSQVVCSNYLFLIVFWILCAPIWLVLLDLLVVPVLDLGISVSLCLYLPVAHPRVLLFSENFYDSSAIFLYAVQWQCNDTIICHLVKFLLIIFLIVELFYIHWIIAQIVQRVPE